MTRLGAEPCARPPFSVNALALAAIEGSVGSDAWRAMVVARVREQRSILQADLTRLGVEYFPSQANFVTARLEPDAVERALAGSGLVVRPGDDLGLPGWVRISIGWAPQMAVQRQALRELPLGKLAPGKLARGKLARGEGARLQARPTGS